MDSTKIAIHVVLQAPLDSADEDLAEQNKLYCSISQPASTYRNYTHNRYSGDSGAINRQVPSMISNLNRQHKREPRDPSFLASELSARSLDRFQISNILPEKLNYRPELSSCIMSPSRQLKKMGWYWGAISPDYASKLLEDQQDGSFLIRDSSSTHYIFSMTFKLDDEIHHARIEHSSGYFSFGRSRKFHCTTMVDFIEQAIECSRNGDLSFFLHRGPEPGPVEFRMIPMSRMNCLNSLKHLSRFAILPYVRKDKIEELSLPDCLKNYLYEPFKKC